MDGIQGYSGWRWIFIIEGLATVVVAVIAKFLIVDWPEKSTFLNDQERALLLSRLSEDRGEARMDRLDGPARKRVFSDIKIYLGWVQITNHVYHLVLLTIIQPSHVLWHRQYWLCDVLFHTDHPASAGMDVSPSTSDEHPNLPRCNCYCTRDCIRQR